jgi:hypothetical protein
MENTINNTANTTNDLLSVYVPFVNEECGDTMWNEVLEQYN